MNEENQNDENDYRNDTVDFSKMMEMAQEFSKYINFNNDIEQQQEKKLTNNVAFVPVEFDEQFQTKEMKAIKAAIPYLKPCDGRKIGIFIKMLELQNIIYSYNNVTSCDIEKNSDEMKKNMLKAIRPHLEHEKQEMINMILKIFELKSIMSKIQKINSLL